MGRGTRTVRDQFSAIFGNRRGAGGLGQPEAPVARVIDVPEIAAQAPTPGLSIDKGLSMNCFAPWQQLDPEVSFIFGDGPEIMGSANCPSRPG